MQNSQMSKKDCYEMICKEILFPLIGISFGHLSEGHIKRTNTKNSFIEYERNEKEIHFYQDTNGDACYIAKVRDCYMDEILPLLRIIFSYIEGTLKSSTGISNKDSNLVRLRKQFSSLAQRGVVDWLCDQNSCCSNVETLLDILEDWKDRTYEGKSLSFCFSIDFKNETPDIPFEEFKEFLKEEYCATFSDGITSLICLNKQLEFVDYQSLTSCEKVNLDYSNGPIRFAEILNSLMEDKIGVFLLNNGDIILAKNKEIKLVKREGKWLNFSKDSFTHYIANILSNSSKNFKKIASEIYLSSLDVSFSHCGGIIAFVDKEKEEELCNSEKIRELVSASGDLSTIQNGIVNYMDNLKVDIPELDSNKYIDQDTKKRFLKRKFLLKTIGGKKFFEIDRKLRAELIGMDGATIINCDGEIVATGAIIQNDSGSYGGGQGAAAKKLSKYGFAIKISTDGYVECYKQGERIFKIK